MKELGPAGGEVPERRNALAEGALLTHPAPVDARIEEKLSLAMVVDMLAVDCDRQVVGRTGRDRNRLGPCPRWRERRSA